MGARPPARQRGARGAEGDPSPAPAGPATVRFARSAEGQDRGLAVKETQRNELANDWVVKFAPCGNGSGSGFISWGLPGLSTTSAVDCCRGPLPVPR